MDRFVSAIESDIGMALCGLLTFAVILASIG